MYTFWKNKLIIQHILLGNRYEFIRIKSEKEFELSNGDSTNDFKIGFPLFYLGIKHKINTHKLKIIFRTRSKISKYNKMSASTNVHGGTYIYPNLNLKPENGWSFESAFHYNKKIKNLLIDFDLMYFLMKYENMMEFSFI